MLPRARTPPLVGFVALAATAGICLMSASASARRQDSSPARFQLCEDDTRCVDVTVRLSTRDAVVEPRVLDTAREIAGVCQAWLGSPLAEIRIGSDVNADAESWIAVARPLIDVPALMRVESEIAYQVARRWTAAALRVGESDDFTQGLAGYLHALAVEQLFDRRYQRRAYAQLGQDVFGGLVHVPIRGIHLTRESLTRRGVDGRASTVAAAFHTLERYLGAPRLQRAVRAAADSGAGDARAFVMAMEAALGQDLLWLFEDLWAGRRVDYRLTGLSTEAMTCASGPCFRTRVGVERIGDAAVTGTNATPAGSFEEGSALLISIAFAGGETAAARWDGRARSHEIWFDSLSPARTARLDPDEMLLLDHNQLDNVRTLAPVTNVTVTRWTAQWSVWLQQTLLTHAFFF